MAVAVLGLLSLVAIVSASSATETRTIQLRWAPSVDADVSGYRFFIQLASGGGVRDGDLGLPLPNADGTLSAIVADLDPDTDYIVVLTAYRADGTHSPPSNQLPIRSACELSPARLRIHHLALGSKGARRRFTARASFRLDEMDDVRTSGVDVALRANDGAVVYRALVPGTALRTGSRQRVWRYHGWWNPRVPGAYGLRTLVLRRRGSALVVRVRAVVQGRRRLTARPLQLAVRLGERCATAAPVACNRRAHRGRCR